ncbi:type II secretion system F family protein [Actinocorallia lasiicapitis]
MTLGVLLSACFVTIFVAVLAIFVARAPEGKDDITDRIAQYRPLRAQKDEAESGSVATALLAFTQRLITAAGKAEKISAELAKAGWRLQPHEWTLLRGIAVFASVAGLWVLTRQEFVSVLVGGALPLLLTKMLLSGARDRRVMAFADQLPDALSMIAGSLRAGFTISQSLERLAQNESRPLGEEMARALAQTRIGVTIEDALDQVAARMDCSDLSWVVLSIRIQREVGGNLADVIETTMETMRERTRLRRHVRALSAEGRLSAYVLLSLPPLLLIGLLLLRPEYMAPMLSSPIGWMMIATGTAGLAIGWFWISRMIRIEL